MFGRIRHRVLILHRRANQSHPNFEVDQLLPLSLQDLCLLEVINDLDAYPLELLASLPNWLRRRLLNNVPVLDLCRLDDTPVARGIDKDELWKTRLWERKQMELRTGGARARREGKSAVPQFMLNVESTYFAPIGIRRRTFRTIGANQDSTAHNTEAGVLTSNEETSAKFARDELLSKLASDVLFGLPCLSQLTSIQGERLLQLNSTSVSPKHSYVWKKQATSLAVQPYVPGVVGQRDPRVVLTPHRLLSLHEKSNLFSLLSLLANDCCTRPGSVNIHINRINMQILHALHTGIFAIESGSKLSSRSKLCISSFNRLLSRVRMLKLKCDNYLSVGIMCSLIEAAAFERVNECNLNILICALPDLYKDVVELLCRIFNLKHFQSLTVEVDNTYLLSLAKLIYSFMTAPCLQRQTLTFACKRMAVQSSDPLDVEELASIPVERIGNVPQCAVEHKELYLSSRHHKFTGILNLLLQLPSVRLNGIRLDGDYEYIHLCALHPDLLVKKLTFVVNNMESHAPKTIRDDVVTLLKMPTLREISISGDWGHDKEFKDGLIQGILQRVKTLPLHSFSFEVESGGCNTEDFRQFCDAIFSLPEIDQLCICLGQGFVDVNYISVIHESWIGAAEGIRLKSLQIKAPRNSGIDTDVLSQFTQRYWFVE